MSTQSLPMLAADRLERLIKVEKFTTVKNLAEQLGRDPRSTRYWRDHGLSTENARNIARVLNLDVAYFHDPEEAVLGSGPIELALAA